MSCTLSDYIDWTASTDVYPHDKTVRVMCLQMGLISEIGEVADKIKKNHRDCRGEETAEFRYSIGQELGDCLWYLARLSRIAPYQSDRTVSVFRTSVAHMMQSIISLGLNGNSMLAIEVLRELAWQWKFTLEDLIQMNQQKLNDRKRRNTLHGSGDER